jgi:hypothetical protein
MSKAKNVSSNKNRQISILSLEKYENILLINFEQLKQVKEVVKSNFSNSQIDTLNLRLQKEENYADGDYTFHKSDKKFWRIKNENLIKLLSKRFDLIIYSNNTPEALIKFSNKIESKLIIGPDDMDNNFILDILIRPSMDEIEYINKIANQINILKHD